MSRLKQIALATFAIVLFSKGAVGDPLPKTATPMSRDEIVALYSGKTLVDGKRDVYFAPDHSAKGILGKSGKPTLLLGTWSVTDNEMCLYTFRQNDPNPYCDCYKYWLDGRRAVTLWSPRSDGSTSDPNNGYYSGEENKLKTGDLVSQRYDSAGGM